MSDQFMNEDLVKTKISYRQLFVRLWPYARREKLLLFAALASVFILAVASRTIPMLIGYAIDHGVLAKNVELFTTVAYIYLGLELIRTLFFFANSYLFQVFGNRMLYHVRDHLMNHVQRLPLQFFNKTPTGRIVTRLTNDVNSLGELFTEGVIAVFTEGVLVISVVIAMAIISWKLTLASLILAPVFIAASIFLSNRIRLMLGEQKKKLSAINAFLAENLNGIKVVQLYNRITKNRQKFSVLSTEYRDLNMKSIHAYALMQPIMNLFNAVTITTALYYGGFLASENALAIGSLIAFLMNIQDFIPPLREILEKYQQFQNSLTSAERIFSLIDEAEESDSADETLPQPFRGQVRFDNLTFRYEDQLPDVLKNISLQINSGESIALVGRTGSGKSTFISLLQRFYDAPAQSIWVDDVAIERIPRNLLRRHVGVVQQDNFIFRGTIQDNVGLHDPTIRAADIELALEKVGYQKLLARTGRSSQSPVEERGANLSVGERQLLAFARILVFNPDIFILDEATANIDSESEHLIQEATREVTKGRTSIIIAHRLSTIEHCDRVLVLSQGELVESGTHKELMSQKGLFYQMTNLSKNSSLIDEALESPGETKS